MTINNIVNLQTENFTIAGNWQYNGAFAVNSPSQININSNGADTIIEANNTKTITIRAGSLDYVAENGNASLRSDTNNVDVFCNTGHLNLHGATGTLSSDTQLDVFTGPGGNINVNTNTGNFSVFAGTGPSPGQIQLGATDTINLFSSTGDIQLSGDGGNASWSAGTGGIGGGVSAMSGCSFDGATGNVSFGAQTGSFLIGALSNSVDILAGTIMTLSATTKLDLASVNVTLSLVTDQAPDAGVPAIVLPVGFKYLVIDDATGQVYKMG